MVSASNTSSIYQRPAELLQRLIQFDTTNPPGNETECIAYIDTLLKKAGLETTRLAKDPNRPNLITRLKGRGSAPPLLLYGHVDVVTTTDQEWTHPPFEGKLVDDFIWGRGALDMKSGIAMMLSAVMRAKTDNLIPAGDIVLAILCDEEAGGEYGAKYLVENHSDQFSGIQYALGEFGSFTNHIGPKRFYPIQIAEKQICWIKATVRGPSGHGALHMRGGAMSKLADSSKGVKSALDSFSKWKLTFHNLNEMYCVSIRGKMKQLRVKSRLDLTPFFSYVVVNVPFRKICRLFEEVRIGLKT